ncbi:ECF RNA polymerase sigma factor SigK [Amycolatopsis sp. RTGN1]|uniref:ECF RNA polymerase sigma factor SigK n=1 Tax=Amycolatopsis ponsaeliensis TaxID=2992142 RepID=UPI00254DB5C2|nr:ECF RNA polymerase sigma factor SigK [Amycolatopsis sp. RTGN1]
MTPEELIGRAAAGDERAFAQLYDHLAGPIHGTVQAVLRAPALAEEVTQEVLLEIWRKAAQFDPERTPKVRTWALTIAHRRAIDRVRSEQAGRDRQDRAARLDVQRPYDEAAEEMLSTMDEERVRRALGELTPLQREAVELAYYHGLTYREVAEKLAVAEGSVKTRIRDGLVRLRAALGTYR